MKKTIRISLIGILSLAIMACMAGPAQADLTIGATSVTSDGVLTLTGDAASTWSTSVGGLTITGAAASTWSTGAGDLTVQSTAGSLNLIGAEDAVDSIKIESTAGGIDILASGATAEDIDIIATGGSVNVNSTENAADSIAITSTNGGIDILASGASGGEDIDILATGSSVNIGATEDAALAIYLHANGGTGETIKILANQGTDLGSIELLSDDGGIRIQATTENTESTTAGAIEIAADAGSISINSFLNSAWNVSDGTLTLVSTSNEASAIKLHADAGASQTIVLLNDEGTGSGAITLTATAGGFDVNAVQASSITVAAAGGSDDLTIEVTNATDSSLVLTSAGTAADALQIEATAGGIDILASGASGGKDIDILATGSSVNIGSTESAALAIYLHANGGTGETIKILANQGTDLGSIELLSDDGGIRIQATTNSTESTTGGPIEISADAGSISLNSVLNSAWNVSGGTLTLVNTTNEANAILLHTNAGVSETIKVHADQGADLGSIELLSDDGGIRIQATTENTESTTAGAIEIAADAGSISINSFLNSAWNVSDGTLTLVSTSNEASAIKLHADAGASQTIVLLNDEGTGYGAIDLTASAGGIFLSPSKGVTIGGGVATSTAGSTTYTAAHFCGSVLQHDPNGGAANGTTETAANLIAACVPTVGDSHTVLLKNVADAAEAITIVAGTSVILLEPDGENVVIDQNNWARIIFTNLDGTSVIMSVDELIDADA